MDKRADLLPSVQLQPHQQRVLEDAAGDSNFRKLLFWQLGAGKSLGGLAAAEGAKGPYAVIAPAALRDTWNRERAKFTDLKQPADVISYTEAAMGKPVGDVKTLLADESHRLRNPTSKQTLRVKQLANKIPNLGLLTGTPIVNEPSDIAPLVSMLTKKEITPGEFAGKYVQEKTVNPGLIARLRGIKPGIETDIGQEDELRSILKGHVDYYAPSGATVPTHFEDIPVDMGPEQSRLYQAMFDQLPWTVRWKLRHDFPLSKEEFRRMQSFMVGPRQVGLSTMPFLRSKDPYRAFSQSTKLNTALKSLQDKLKDERTKALIFSNFIDAGLRPYASALEKAGVPHAIFHGGLNDAQRKQLVEDYNNNRIRVALLGPSGAEGLSFKGTQLVQLLDPYWHNVRTRQQQGRGIRFDSHTDLPEELRNVTVQRFISRMPLGTRDRWLSALGFNRDYNRIAADDILRRMSERKDALNQKFIDLLKDIGTPKTAAFEQSSDYLPYLGGGAATLLGYLAIRKALRGSENTKKKQPISLTDLLNTPYYTEPEKLPNPKDMWIRKEAAISTIPIIHAQSPIPDATLDAPPGQELGPVSTTPELGSLPKKGILAKLHQAKKYSDERNWLAKQSILREVMAETPYQWTIEDDPKMPRHIVGVRHIFTGYQFHLPRAAIPAHVYEEVRYWKNKQPIEMN